jgi:tetratricopeptide (TPR) repeat protein
MFWALPLLALSLSANPTPPDTHQKSFVQIAQQADDERVADHVEEAIRLYGAGVRLRPGWSEGWWSLGSLLYDQDRFPEAEIAFRRFVTITPKAGPAYAFLGLCEYDTGRYDLALQHLRKWAGSGWPGTPELIDVAAFHLALLLTREGRFVEALFLFATEAGKSHRSPALAEAMGLAALRMKDLPEDYPRERREMVWLAGEGTLYASLPSHEYDRADEYARRLSLRYGQEANVHYFRGTLLGFAGKTDQAKQEFEQELRISPHHVPAMVELARIAIDAGQTAQAESLAKAALQLEPENPEAHHLLGRVLLATDRVLLGARELETAKRLAPESATIRSHLAMAYTRLGRKQEAETETAAFVALKNTENLLGKPYDKISKPAKPGQTQ